MSAATLEGMGRKREKPKDEPAPEVAPGTKDRAADRHESTFMVRLPEEFRTQLDKVRDEHYRKHRYRQPYTVLVSQAVEKFLAELDLWPPA